ncbi:MAG: cupin domain-containing protein [Pseudonocardiaceae bacterium]
MTMEIQPKQAGVKGPANMFTHAVGQMLHVTEDRGLIQSRGGEVIEIRPGDTIYTPRSQWHWHGAAPDHFMTHIARWEGHGEGHGRSPSGVTSSPTRNTTSSPRPTHGNREAQRHANHNIGQHGPRGRRHRPGMHGHDPRLRHESPT